MNLRWRTLGASHLKFRVYEVIPQSKWRQIGDISGPIFGGLDSLVAASGCLKDLGLKDVGLKDFRV